LGSPLLDCANCRATPGRGRLARRVTGKLLGCKPQNHFSFSAKFATSPLKIPPICRHESFQLTLDALMTLEMNGWELPNKIK
jgi:hypothetical protein